MKGSRLIIQIVEARDLLGIRSAYTEITFDDANRQATTIKKNLNAVTWNEKFTFDVIRGDESALIKVYDASNRNLIGSCTYNLKSFPSAKFTDDSWHSLTTTSQRSVGQIRLIVQWIESEVKLINYKLENLDRELNENQDKLAFFIEKRNILHRKFYSHIDPFEVFKPSNEVQVEEAPKESTTKIKPAVPVDDIIINERKAREKVDVLVPELVTTLGLNKVSIPELSKYIIWIYMTLSFISLLARSDFFNVNHFNIPSSSLASYSTMPSSLIEAN